MALFGLGAMFRRRSTKPSFKHRAIFRAQPGFHHPNVESRITLQRKLLLAQARDAHCDRGPFAAQC